VERTVWTGAEADIWVFREDANGNVVNPDGSAGSTVAMFYCFGEGLSLTAAQPLARRAVTGRCRKKIVPLSLHFEEVQLQVDSLYIRRATQFSIDVYNTGVQLRVVVKFWKLTYSNAAPFENDQYDLSFARAQQFSINSAAADPVTNKANFEAELILPTTDNTIVPQSALI